MYIDIIENDNLERSAMATFKETGPGTVIARAYLSVPCVGQPGVEEKQWCAVIGWNEDGPCPACLTPIEESGDGPAVLITGGAWGVRVARLEAELSPLPNWDLDNSEQWAEAYLLCRPTLQWRA